MNHEVVYNFCARGWHALQGAMADVYFWMRRD